MMRKKKLVFRMGCVVICMAMSSLFAFSQEKQEPITTRILFIFDASNSMNARWQSDTKMAISKKLLANILDSLGRIPNLELALRVYGHQSQYPPLDCEDSKLEVPFAPNNAKRIIHKIKMLTPKGATPIAYSLRKAAEDFPPKERTRNLIILITDGIEECAGDPCAASEYLQQRGITLKPFIIGIGSDFANAFDCVGQYFDASREEEFVKAFDVVISQAMNSTSAQVNLLDHRGEPTETNVNMSFYNHASGKLYQNFMHTLNFRGLPDTISLDPLMTYNMVVHTRPQKRLDSIVVKSGVHNTIAVDVPQGQLMVKMVGSRAAIAKTIPCVIREHGISKTLHVQYVNEVESYLTGTYDIEVLCLPRLIVPNVKVSPNHTTYVDLPMPGILNIQKGVEGHGSIYAEVNSELVLVYNLKESEKTETLYLQPGAYRVVYRSKYINKIAGTREKSVFINPGGTVSINF